MTLLQLTGLTLQRGLRVLAQGIDLTLSAGEICHVTGANGTGKTTLLETAAGLRPPVGGQVLRPAARHWLGHRNALSGHLSAEQNLLAWAGLQEDAYEAPLAVLRQLGVPAPRRRPARLLSVGQRRRVALARLLLAPRPLWILDEPLDGLDREGIDLLGRLLQQQAEGGGAVFITSHQALPAGLPGLRQLHLEAA